MCISWRACAWWIEWVGPPEDSECSTVYFSNWLRLKIMEDLVSQRVWFSSLSKCNRLSSAVVKKPCLISKWLQCTWTFWIDYDHQSEVRLRKRCCYLTDNIYQCMLSATLVKQILRGQGHRTTNFVSITLLFRMPLCPKWCCIKPKFRLTVTGHSAQCTEFTPTSGPCRIKRKLTKR